MKISTILFFCLLMTACMQTKILSPINGWYYVTSQITDSLSQTPFLTVKDFDSLRLKLMLLDTRSLPVSSSKINCLYGEKPQQRV